MQTVNPIMAETTDNVLSVSKDNTLIRVEFNPTDIMRRLQQLEIATKLQPTIAGANK